MGWWSYERTLLGAAGARAWSFMAGKLGWGLPVLIGSALTGLLIAQWLGLTTGQAVAVAAACGVGGVCFAIICAWITQVVRAPYLRDREQRAEIDRLNELLDPEFRVNVSGPQIFEAQGQVFLLFSATAINGATTCLSLLPRLRMEVVSALWMAVEAEPSPIRAWEEVRRQSSGGLPAYLTMPLDLDPGRSTTGYLGFAMPSILLAIARRRGVAKLAIQVEELGSRKRSQEWAMSVNLTALGLKEIKPPAGPPSTTAE